jgi:hypothetical protein
VKKDVINEGLSHDSHRRKGNKKKDKIELKRDHKHIHRMIASTTASETGSYDECDHPGSLVNLTRVVRPLKGQPSL